VPQVAYPLGRFKGEGEGGESKVDMYADDLFTVPASLAGLPAISVPTPTQGLPIGELALCDMLVRRKAMPDVVVRCCMPWSIRRAANHRPAIRGSADFGGRPSLRAGD
jgi:hypothetical protein